MDWQLLSLLGLGVAAAVSPCPLATNIAALGFISRDLDSRRMSLAASACYTVGRGLAYVLIGFLVSEGLSSAPLLSFWMQEELPVYLGPLMMATGFVILGFLFALAMCPPSAALFFGTAIPWAVQAGSRGAWFGISLFGVGTALPVVAFSLLLVFSARRAAVVMRHMPKIQQRMKTATGWFFLGLGGYWLFSRILFV